jgi:fatty-acyl-CoA synthase
MLLRTPGTEKVDLSRWKVLIGGASMPKALALAALARGIDAAAGYGMSETCPILSTAHLDEADLAAPAERQAEIRSRTGRSIPLVQLRVVDDRGAEQPRDGSSTGEIVVRAPWLTQGYLKDAKASDKLWAGGWLHTGDVAWRDERGYVKITDRTKDVVKVGGEWISSLEIEDALLAHAGVAEAAVIAMPDAKWGERPLALVVAKPEAAGKLTEKELHHLLHDLAHRGALNKQVVVSAVRFVDAIDKTSVGKVNKVALRQKHLG